ncbi:hypothetical protein LSTR_LSTR006232 [Laodelphax striatellus]|uniref:FAD dependent oxidoreductase domain-containing protein n=1 Tax=Laodelphax striatellus TaxID=195883 RepID=A0A482XQ42_LAOST|nr:hypothetical protein LSTR_LSTR006232 [Laodelphax striatellus]
MGVFKVCVVGAGVVGLTSALEIQNTFPSAEVCLTADKFNKDTTSDGAAGLFRPGNSFCGASVEVTKKWIKDSYSYYNDLISDECGIKEIGGYIFSSTSKSNVQNHFLEDIVPIYRSATNEELKLCPGEWQYGSYFTTLLIECRRFLPWALNRFKSNGGRVNEKSIQSFDEIPDDFNVIVNCTGFGAKYLCKDLKMVPIRGQVIKVKAPWLQTFFYGDYDTYIIPGFDGNVTLGGCRNYDSYDVSLSKYDRGAIMERCCSLVPELKSAPVVREWVGLRPHRDPVRVQFEKLGNKSIVHNYGHGGYGVTSAPGTAKHAVSILLKALSRSANSKL